MGIASLNTATSATVRQLVVRSNATSFAKYSHPVYRYPGFSEAAIGTADDFGRIHGRT